MKDNKNMTLSDRQKRELQFYDEYADLTARDNVSFDIVASEDNRPWNSYWRVFEIIRQACPLRGQKILDFGCGDGSASMILAKMGYEVFGFDISPNNISHAIKLSEKYTFHERTHFHVSTAEDLDFPDDYFSLIVGIDILHHIEIEAALVKCFAMVRPGGMVIFHEPVRVPIFDRLRETKLGLWLFPRKSSVASHITEDERKLTKKDRALLRASRFSCVTEERFYLFARLNRLVRKFTKGKALFFFLKLDYYLFMFFPFLKNFGGVSIITLKK